MKPHPSSPDAKPRGRSTVLWTVLACGVFVVLSATRIIPSLAIFSSAPMNGAFQLFNPLKRLAAGEMLTRDFDFFHGIGTLLIHYPVFHLAGGDLFASEIARHLLSPLAFLATFLIVGSALRLPSWLSAAGAAMTYAVCDITGLGSGALSGNSMIGLRSTLPVLAIPITLLLGRKIPLLSKPIGFHTSVGCILGISIFIATEQGLAAFAVHAAVLAVIPDPKFRFLNRAACIAALVAAFTFTYLLLIGVFSGWRIFETLAFSLVDLSKDQFWYYGAPPNPLAGWLEIPWTQEFVIGFWFPLGFFLVEAVHLLRKRERWSNPPPHSVLIMVVAGMSMAVQLLHLATLSHYHLVSVRNMGIIAIIWVGRAIRAWSPAPLVHWLGHPAFLLAAIAGFCGLLAQRAFHIHATLERRSKDIGSTKSHGRVRLSKDWQKDLDVWEKLAKPATTVSGTYRSLPDDVNLGSFGGPDYIIHALGGKQGQFLASLVAQKPDYFHTINPRHSSYEEWLQLRHWDVYQHLLGSYRPIVASPYHVFWKRLPEETPLNTGMVVGFQRDSSGARWTSPSHSGRRSLYEVSVEYGTENPIASAPFFGKLPRYFLDRAVVTNSGTAVDGLACSLPPHKTLWVFPMVLDDGDRAVLSPRIFMPTPGASFNIVSMTMKPLPSDPRILDALIGTDESGLFVSPDNVPTEH